MLKAHMDAKEAVLVAISKVPANSGHSLHKGTPREAFIREFLASHLPQNVAIGTGEIIDANSQPGQKRNQFDIVIYKTSYPRLDFGGGINGFLIESVIATVEVKSDVTNEDIKQASGAARNAKALTPHIVESMRAGWLPPKVLNYVVAYDGPAQMSTVYGWVSAADKAIGDSSNLPIGPSRTNTAAPSLDGVFVLGKGFAYFDNIPLGFVTDENRASAPNMKWVFTDLAAGNLLLFFFLIQSATANVEARFLNAVPYLASFKIANIQAGP